MDIVVVRVGGVIDCPQGEKEAVDLVYRGNNVSRIGNS